MAIVPIFFKVPTPGAVKTRLAAGVGNKLAAELATAFFLDTLDNVNRAPGLSPVVATNGVLPQHLLSEISCPIWQQGEGTLDERLERIFRRGLTSSEHVIAMGADSPGLSQENLVALASQLKDHDAVLGPTEDGGYYALGLKSCPTNLLKDIPWSSPLTCIQTESRLQQHGLRTIRAPEFFDIDHPSDLERLAGLLLSGGLKAPRTFYLLETRGWGNKEVPSAVS